MARVVKAAAVRVAETWSVGTPSASLVAESAVDEPSVPMADFAELRAAAEAEAARIVAEAHQQADALFEEAKKAALQTELDAYEAGKAEGFEAGRQAGLASLERLVAIVDGAIVEWEQAIRDAEEQIVELALTVAGRIVGRISAEDDQTALASMMQALDHLAASPTVKVRLHPDDYDLVVGHWAETRGPAYRDREWTFLSDRNVASGGCILELEGGRIDAQLDTQMTEIRRALRAAGGFDDHSH
ncbi:MAG: FliH/SctL family protein [Dehalococcoidia bacterium]